MNFMNTSTLKLPIEAEADENTYLRVIQHGI